MSRKIKIPDNCRFEAQHYRARNLLLYCRLEADSSPIKAGFGMTRIVFIFCLIRVIRVNTWPLFPLELHDETQRRLRHVSSGPGKQVLDFEIWGLVNQAAVLQTQSQIMSQMRAANQGNT